MLRATRRREQGISIDAVLSGAELASVVYLALELRQSARRSRSRLLAQLRATNAESRAQKEALRAQLRAMKEEADAQVASINKVADEHTASVGRLARDGGVSDSGSSAQLP